ncbi:hypothetical protein B0H13DRAFT_2381210 [Mycena leptocephala]|nr:hypothetical protein B0H13DRAFT_2381210 [Mycena leptocephala]
MSELEAARYMSNTMDCEDARSLLLAQRRLMQAEDEKRFLRRRRHALEQELAVLKRTTSSGSPACGILEEYPAKQTNVHEPVFWRLDAPLSITCITQVLSSERALLGEHRDLFKRDLKELGLQVDKLRGTVDGVSGAMGMLRTVIEAAIGRDLDATLEVKQDSEKNADHQ